MCIDPAQTHNENSADHLLAALEAQALALEQRELLRPEHVPRRAGLVHHCEATMARVPREIDDLVRRWFGAGRLHHCEATRVAGLLLLRVHALLLLLLGHPELNNLEPNIFPRSSFQFHVFFPLSKLRLT